MTMISSIHPSSAVERLGSCTSGLTQFRLRLNVWELALGMRVDELDKPWLDSPFLFQGFFIDTEEELAAVRRECEYVYVTITRQLDKPLKKIQQKTTQSEYFTWS